MLPVELQWRSFGQPQSGPFGSSVTLLFLRKRILYSKIVRGILFEGHGNGFVLIVKKLTYVILTIGILYLSSVSVSRGFSLCFSSGGVSLILPLIISFPIKNQTQ